MTLSSFISCGSKEDGNRTDTGGIIREDGSGTPEEVEITKPVLPVNIPAEEYRGKEVFIDEESGYEYVIEELDPGNPPLVIMANDFLDDYDKWDIIADFNNIPDARKIPDYTPLKIPIGKAPDFATISEIRNQVIMKRTVDPDWRPAKLKIKLSNGDGVRTLENSETTIKFGSGSELSVGENSMVFISDLVREDIGKPSESNLNLEDGTLTITKKGLSSDEEISVTTTDAIVRAEAIPYGEVSFRTKTTKDKSTLVMSYRGNLEVSAAGESVVLKSGEGAEVKKGSGPSAPKTLLPPPVTGDKPETVYYYGDPTLNWNAVDGAVDYIVQIAYDRGFSHVYKIVKSLTNTKVKSDFATGKYYWRVCAVDEEGFEGYWSRVYSFEIVNEGRDLKEPVTTFEFVGDDPINIGGVKYVSRGSGIRFAAEDDLSGVEAIFISVDGAAEKHYDGKVIYLGDGEHEIEYYSLDRRGREEKKNRLSFIVDDIPPKVSIVPSISEGQR